MEDYIPILIAAILMLIKLLSPNKKKAEPLPEKFPDFSDTLIDFTEMEKENEDNDNIFTENFDTRTGKSIPSYESLGAIPVVEGGYTTDTGQKLEAMRKEITNHDPDPDKKPEILDDFEVRKAILYNEILRPKFLD